MITKCSVTVSLNIKNLSNYWLFIERLQMQITIVIIHGPDTLLVSNQSTNDKLNNKKNCGRFVFP